MVCNHMRMGSLRTSLCFGEYKTCIGAVRRVETRYIVIEDLFFLTGQPHLTYLWIWHECVFDVFEHFVNLIDE